MIADYPVKTLFVLLPLIFLSGFMDAIAGGGGLISLPAYLLAGIPAHLAIATNKLSSSMGLTVSTARYLKRGYVDWLLAIPAALFSIVGASAGAKLNLLIPEAVIRYLLIGVLPVTAFIVLKKRDLSSSAAGDIPRRKQILIISAGAFFIGMYDGFYGPGAGTFTLLLLTGAAGLDIRTASGNMKIANLCSNLGALYVYITSGQTQIPLGIAAGCAAVLGQYIGSGLVLKNGTKVVRPVVLTVLGLLFLRVILELGGIL